MIIRKVAIVRHVLAHPVEDGLHLLPVGTLAGGEAVGEIRDLMNRAVIPFCRNILIPDDFLHSGGASRPPKVGGQHVKYGFQTLPVPLRVKRISKRGSGNQGQGHDHGQNKGQNSFL